MNGSKALTLMGRGKLLWKLLQDPEFMCHHLPVGHSQKQKTKNGHLPSHAIAKLSTSLSCFQTSVSTQSAIMSFVYGHRPAVSKKHPFQRNARLCHSCMYLEKILASAACLSLSWTPFKRQRYKTQRSLCCCFS